MKFEITRKNERGHAEHGWLNANHYFSFGGYYNSEKMGFGKLRVINDDRIAPSTGFAKHPHENMEIITIPLAGAVRHKDSDGNEGVISKGEVQVMSAGTGIMHSEHNNSATEDLKLFQIWIEPNKMNVNPRYEQRNFEALLTHNNWTEVVSSITKKSEAVKIHQDASIKVGKFDKGEAFKLDPLQLNRGYYLLISSGEIKLADHILSDRDAIALAEVEGLEGEVLSDLADLILIEVPL